MYILFDDTLDAVYYYQKTVNKIGNYYIKYLKKKKIYIYIENKFFVQ